MCGIAGFISQIEDIKRRNIVLQEMLEAIKHRGPDDEGASVDSEIALGVKRLSIIDIKGGGQPIFNEDNSKLIVCNGEIYNYLQLRDFLIKRGHRFSTNTDIEVVLHLYEEYGDDCINKLEGMFAFAIWDKVRKELLLARDRFGMKPLYYLNKPGDKGLIFASELKALLKFPDLTPELDWNALDQYLRLEYIPSPRSMFKNIFKLPAAHLLSYKNGELSIRKYWEVSFSKHEEIDEKDAEEKLLFLLKESITKHIISDVPIGFLLSGGLDSSTLVALASQINKNRIKTFSIDFEERSFDESKFNRRVSRIYNTEHYHCSFGLTDLMDLIEQSSRYLDEPIADGSFFPTFALSRFTRQQVKVALSGEGADEIFAGYPTYQAHAVYPIYQRLPFAIRERIIPEMAKLIPVSMANFSLDFKLKKFISSQGPSLLKRHLDWMGAFSPEDKISLYSQEIQCRLDEEKTGIFNEFQFSSGADDITRLQYFDIKTYLQDNLLSKVDRASMANGLEVRVPYLDHKIVEFAMSLPTKFRFRNLNGKCLLKKLASRMLPHNIVYRSKKGFGMPTSYWLTKGLKVAVENIFKQGHVMETGWFNPGYLRNILSDHLSGQADQRKKIWTIVMLEMWLKEWGKLL